MTDLTSRYLEQIQDVLDKYRDLLNKPQQLGVRTINYFVSRSGARRSMPPHGTRFATGVRGCDPRSKSSLCSILR